MSMYDMDALLDEQIDQLQTREWTGKIGSQEVTLNSRPITPKDFDMVGKKYPDIVTQPTPAAMAAMIVRKAKDPDGNPAFKPKHHERLVRDEVTHISEIFIGLFADDYGWAEEEHESAVKNS